MPGHRVTRASVKVLEPLLCEAQGAQKGDRLVASCCCFDTGSHSIAQTGLELIRILP